MKRFVYWIVALLFCFSASSQAAELTGKIVGVHDGDTVTVLTSSNKQVKIRLAEIDAPELKQPYGNRSKQALSDLVFGMEVSVVQKGTDKYGRTIARVYQGNTDINLTLVRQGAAWAYKQYLTDDAFLEAETSARASNTGLWGLQEDQRIPPWVWRHPEKITSKTGASAENLYYPLSEAKAGITCAGKTVCRQMTNCAEAKFYLTKCGVIKLDGDHDGVPCETLCR